MRRSLVLTSEHARHPFRRSLPPHVTRALPVAEPEVLAAEARATGEHQGRRLGDDAQWFLSSYCAGLFAFGLFLS